METGIEVGLGQNAGRSRSDLKPMCTVNGEMARSIQASARFGLRVVQENDLCRQDGKRGSFRAPRPPGRHHADEIRGVNDVERIPLANFEVRGVHFEQTNVGEALAGNTGPRLLEHRGGQVDAVTVQSRSTAWR